MVEGKYEIKVNDKKLTGLKGGVSFSVSKLSDSKINLTYKGKSYTTTRNILFEKTSDTAMFQINAIGDVFRPKRSYFGGLNFLIDKSENKLRAINLIDVDTYLEGVVETEGGGGKELEYYKVQAVMSRTFALKNTHRHKKNGYDVCDATHCQAYYSRMRFTPKIKQAVKATTGEVVIDENYKLITGFFHANCGGQTIVSSFVWNNDLPYLKSVQDPFCVETRQAKWRREMSSWAWYKYMRDNYDATEDKTFKDSMYIFSQPFREMFYVDNAYGIPLHKLRTDFKLKSTFFSVSKTGDKILLEGRGFGHGVGLCQEGAMNMSRNYTYRQIISFYFKNVQVVPYDFALAQLSGEEWGWNI